jgi:hypothetical protein
MNVHPASYFSFTRHCALAVAIWADESNPHEHLAHARRMKN